jgi:hypothetical protein
MYGVPQERHIRQSSQRYNGNSKGISRRGGCMHDKCLERLREKEENKKSTERKTWQKKAYIDDTGR